MKKFVIFVLIIAAVNRISWSLDSGQEAEHSEDASPRPLNVRSAHHEQVPVGTAGSQGQGQHGHVQDHGHEPEHVQHAQKPVVETPVQGTILHGEKPVGDRDFYPIPVRPQYVSGQRYQHHHYPTVSAHKVPFARDQILMEHDQVPPIGIVHQAMEINPDGSFHNVWEGENGIKVQEEGTVRVIDRKTSVQIVTGQISYTDKDGNEFFLKYVADEFGFHPVGDHLPTPPPIPIGIARGLEWIAAHPPPKETEDVSDIYVTVEHN